MEETFDFTVCSICLNNFTKPKIIDCFHSYCEVCLENYVKRSSVNNQFPCPLCRKWITIPRGGVKGFVNNFYIKDTPTDTEIQVCPKHNDDKSDKYCKDCSIIACTQCLKINHQSHKIISLDDAKEDAKQGLEYCKQTMHNQLTKFNKYIGKVRMRIFDIQEHKCAVATEIEEHVEKVCEAARQCGTELISQVTETSIEEEMRLHSIIVDTKNFIHQSEATKQYGSHIIKENNVEDIINVKKLITQQCEENKNRRLQVIPTINNLAFRSAGDVQPSDLMSYIGSLERTQEDILEYSFSIDRIKNRENCSPIFRKGLRNWQIIAGMDTLAKGKTFLYISIKLVGINDTEEEEEEGVDVLMDEKTSEIGFEGDKENAYIEEEFDDISTKISVTLLNESLPKSKTMSQYHTFSPEDPMLEFSKIIYVKNMINDGFINNNRKFMVRAYLEYGVD